MLYCTMAARGLRGMREWRRYIDHVGGARVGLNAIVQVSCTIRSHACYLEGDL